MIKKLTLVSVLVFGILLVSQSAFAVPADDRAASYGLLQCTKRGSSTTCRDRWANNDSNFYQAFKVDGKPIRAEGYGSFGASGGRVSVTACFTQYDIMFENGASCWYPYPEGKIGDTNNQIITLTSSWGKAMPLDGSVPPYNYVSLSIFVDDASVFMEGGTVYGRRVAISKLVSDKPSVLINDTFIVTWQTKNSFTSNLTWSGPIEKVPGGAPENIEAGSITFKATGTGTATFNLSAAGPGIFQQTSIKTGETNPADPDQPGPLSVTITSQPPITTTPPPPGYVNLNFNVTDNCNASPVAGAGVTISKDFGNGTTRTTDGNGFANFGALKDSGALGWNVVANGYNTSSGNTSIGSVDVNVPVSLTRDCSVPPPPPTTTSPPPPPPGSVNLSITTSGSGTVITNDGKVCSGLNQTCTFQYLQNSTPELTATPGSGWSFSGWSGQCGTIIGNTCYMGMTTSKSVTATFSQTISTRILTISKTGSGTIVSSPAGIICGTTCSSNFPLNSIVTLTATPGPGLGVTWNSGCDSIQGNVCSVTMSANKTVTATFAVGTGTISIVSKEVSTGSPVNTNWALCYGGLCNQPGTSIVRQETNVSSQTYTNMSAGQYDLNVLPEGTTHVFDHFDITPTNQFLSSGSTLSYIVWYKPKTSVGTPSCSANPLSVQVGQSTTLSASGGSGSYTWSAPGGSSTSGSGSTFTTSYSTTGTKTVTVTSSGQSGSCTVNVSSVPVGKVKVIVHKLGSGSGTVTAANISCGPTCSTAEFNYNFGDAIVFSHSESSGSAWGGWSGACTDFNNCIIDMRPEGSVKDLYATFNLINPPPPNGQGNIVVTTNCNHTYTLTGNSGQVFGATGNMTFNDKPAGTYTIDWEPKPITTVTPSQTQTLGGGQTITFSLSSTACTGGGGQEQQPTSVEAVCTVNVTPRYTLTVSKAGSGSGTITASGISCGNDCSEAYNDGTVVNVSATSNAGSIFGGWSGACSGNGSCSVTMNSDKSVTAIFNGAPTVSNVTITDPNYCISGPAATIGWTYSDPTGSPQLAYQVQVSRNDKGTFNNPEIDSGKVNSNSNAYFTGQGVLQFNTTYKARVRAWNSYDIASDWVESKTWKTPAQAYPQVDFTWSPLSPQVKKSAQFTDQTTFYGNQNGRQWNWLFGDGGSATQQNPLHTYSAEGIYYTTLTATDSDNQSCSRTKGPISVQKPIPKWREIAPK